MSRLVRAIAALAFVISATARAQVAPTGGHYGGRPGDSGFAGLVNSNGGYQASVPFDFPPTRDGLPLPVQVVFGGKRMGAAGVGWDVPLSFIRKNDSLAWIKPKNNPNQTPEPRALVTMTLQGQTYSLMQVGAAWVSRENGSLISASQDAVGDWTVYDGQGHTYTFENLSGTEALGLWFLSSITGPHGMEVKLVYDPEIIPLNGGVGGQTAVSIDLVSVLYGYTPTQTCPKYEIDLAYGTTDPNAPILSLTVLGGIDTLRARTHLVSALTLSSRPDCGTAPTVLRTYGFSYQHDLDTQFLRLTSVQVAGRAGSPEASTPLPVATYHYGVATNLAPGSDTARSLFFQFAANVQLPAGPNNDYISATTAASQGPSPGQQYTTTQDYLDVTGDGIPDIVYLDQTTQQMSVAVGKNNSNDTLSFGGTNPLGDSGSGPLNGPLSSRVLTTARFSPTVTLNSEDVWRQAIDVNGDGRVDIIDAGAECGFWTVWLNTPTCPLGQAESRG